MFRSVIWALVVVVAIAAGSVYLLRPPPAVSGVTGAPFTMVSTKGGTFSQASFAGTPTLLFFGYTFCPDVCPTTLAEVTAIRDELKLGANQLRIVFATVDPDRDTLPILKTYLGAFGDDLVGLSGTQAQVDKMKAAFGVYSAKGNDNGTGTYLVTHTANIFLIDKSGKFAATIEYGEDVDTETQKIKRLTGA